MEDAGIRPTANRILVYRALLTAEAPQSLLELEASLRTLERSSILRVLTLLVDHKLIHVMEDGRGIAKYEICTTPDSPLQHSDLHPHFYCTRCLRTFCLQDIRIPAISLPSGFMARSANFMYKGLCPDCARQLNH